MLLTSLLYCYGGFIQNEENRIVIGQGANRKGAIQALEVMRDIYKNGMSDEVFAWTAASNNQAFLAGRLSVALNAISIARSAEDSGNQRSVGRHVARLDPARARDAPGQRARDGRLPDLEVRQEQGGGAEVRRRPAARLPRPLRAQQVLQLPALDGCDQGRLQGDPQADRAGPAQAEGQVHDPDDDRREVHDEPRSPRQLHAGDGRDLQHVPDPADVRRGGPGEVDPRRGASRPSRARRRASTASGTTRSSCRAGSVSSPEGPVRGPRLGRAESRTA